MSPVHLAQIEALQEKLAEEATKSAPDPRWIAAANLEFHRAVCEAARNQLLREFMARIHDTMGRFIHTAFRRPGRVVELVEERPRLVAALAARDADQAEFHPCSVGGPIVDPGPASRRQACGGQAVRGGPSYLRVTVRSSVLLRVDQVIE
jgi:hypothetical protein